MTKQPEEQIERRRHSRIEALGVPWLELWDALNSPTAQDTYAGLAAITAVILCAEIALAIFGHPY